MGRQIIVLVALVGIVVALSAGSFAADNGKEIFNSHCAKCHGADGRAKTAAAAKMAVANLRSSEVQNLSDKEMYDTIAYGKKHKQYPHAYLYTGLTENQIRLLVAHIRTFK